MISLAKNDGHFDRYVNIGFYGKLLEKYSCLEILAQSEQNFVKWSLIWSLSELFPIVAPTYQDDCYLIIKIKDIE